MSPHLRQFLVQTRLFSTTRLRYRPALSSQYKSKDLWEERFECGLLGNDQNLIKTINTKILSDSELTNLEVDVFINIAAPRKKDLDQLQEAVKTLRKFRKSLHAHTLLPSTSHAICRLFADSEKLPSLTKLLEKRVEFGIFPDPFALNILFDQALEQEQYALAARLGALIMLQEEFGLNQLSDNFALYSVAKYLESKPDFSDWNEEVARVDAILDPVGAEQAAASQASEQAKKDESGGGDEEEEEDEEDAEYIRVPFLRNPYHDNHFDLSNPRHICGKTLSMFGLHAVMASEPALGAKCRALGDIVLGKWAEARSALDACAQSKAKVDDTFVETAKFFLETSDDDIAPPEDQVKQALLAKLDKLPRGGLSLSDEADARHASLKAQHEVKDIEQLRHSLKEWSQQRHQTLQAFEDIAARKALIEEIRAKKRELKHREQYLFFYENLKKRNLARIDYD